MFTMRQLADILEAVNDAILQMERETPRDHEYLESMRDTRKRVRFLLRQAVAQSNQGGSHDGKVPRHHQGTARRSVTAGLNR